MNEDEAFIRTIVDRPGDDLPRLVYADWLDERDDPRGAYLRAEVEWAQPWKHGVPPGWTEPTPENHGSPEWESWDWPGLTPLIDLGERLDSLWVARVSRPPIGVCCDHLQFSKSEVRLTSADVLRASERFNFPIPTPFSAFLLNHNGGTPSYTQLIYSCGEPDARWWDWIRVEAFCWLPTSTTYHDNSPDSLDAQLSDLHGFDSDWGLPVAETVAARFFPVATLFTGGWLLLPKTFADDPGVYELSIGGADDTPRLLVASFPEVLARIVTFTL